MTIPIFLIGLERATGRARLMEQELQKAGLSATRVNAVDCDAATREDFLRECKAEGPWGYFHTKDMACTLSHAKAWEALIASGAEQALILEDDVFLSPELADWLNDPSWWPADADIVRFERWRSTKLYVALGRKRLIHLGRELRLMRSRHPGGAAYALTRQAAQHFLAQKPYDITLDGLLFNPSASPAARQINIYQVIPAMVEQGNEAPGEYNMGAPRSRPTGWPLVRQKIRRGIVEISSGLRTTANLALGRATLEKIPYAPQVLPATEPNQSNTA
ncbi:MULTISPECIES: glycosyltransferase family 25 protein [unclassified Ruegeria]|uniref:glycosyltransferase family 25 protein n=1 Tax=unclassified Ruegeria TaxID=2625375 RepID=UPI001488500B|nr:MULTISPECIES: glycosyltransferase family 25 protein [unclassified Ruegeria]NOD76557.1 glycosyl transferase [Ruegeria sp. HKCCD4332]NOD89277.1 glycosyl transferase [Ruegeria sp. HKCCD4318]NOE13560.1 glycosyl transferase [Ruegeria sp. HKCCD4318-2]NOG07690.1 glycosyltransferase family 25 protein [Ruegeria sp. HKCCD4315]